MYATALIMPVQLAIVRGDFVAGEQLLAEILDIYRSLGDTRQLGATLHNLGALTWSRGDITQAEQLFLESLALRRVHGQMQLAAPTMHRLAELAIARNDPACAMPYATDALALSQQLNSREDVIASFAALGGIAMLMGDFDIAHEHLLAALDLAQEIGDRWAESELRDRFPKLELERGNLTGARRLGAEALRYAAQLRHVSWVTDQIEVIAATVVDDPTLATRLFAAASVERRRQGQTLNPAPQRQMDERIARLRATVSPAVWAAAWSSGSALTFDDAVALALEYATR